MKKAILLILLCFTIITISGCGEKEISIQTGKYYSSSGNTYIEIIDDTTLKFYNINFTSIIDDVLSLITIDNPEMLKVDLETQFSGIIIYELSEIEDEILLSIRFEDSSLGTAMRYNKKKQTLLFSNVIYTLQ